MRRRLPDAVHRGRRGFSFAYGGSKRPRHGPSSVQSIGETILPHTKFKSPVCQTLSSPLVLNQAAGPFISSLLSAGSPVAVLWAVVPVVVLPVERVSLRPWSHILKEVFEGIKPTIADLDASSAIPLEPLVFGVVASVLHVRPRAVLSRLCVAVAGHDFFSQASAAFGVTVPKGPSANGSLLSTRAETQTKGVWDVTKHGKPAECLPCFIVSSHQSSRIRWELSQRSHGERCCQIA